MNRPHSHRYSIPPDFGAGVVRDSRMVIMGLLCPDLVACFFNRDGDFLAVEKRHLGFLQRSGVLVDGEPIEGQVRYYNIDDERIPVHLQAWQAELGFEPAMIKVKKFGLPDLYIGIQDRPDHFSEILADPDASEEEKNEVRGQADRWDAEGQFVFWWAKDHWLDRSGEQT